MKIEDSKNSTECDSCGKILSNKYILEQHKKQVHANMKLFSCDTCGKYFPSKYTLNRHIDSVHLKLKPYKCGNCDKSYTRVFSAKVYSIRIHCT